VCLIACLSCKCSAHKNVKAIITARTGQGLHTLFEIDELMSTFMSIRTLPMLYFIPEAAHLSAKHVRTGSSLSYFILWQVEYLLGTPCSSAVQSYDF